MAIKIYEWTREENTYSELLDVSDDCLPQTRIIVPDQSTSSLECHVHLWLNNFRPNITINLHTTKNVQTSELVDATSNLDLSDRSSASSSLRKCKCAEEVVSILVTQDCVEHMKLIEIPRELPQAVYQNILRNRGPVISNIVLEASKLAKPGEMFFLCEIQSCGTFTIVQNPQVQLSPSVALFLNSIVDQTTIRFVSSTKPTIFDRLKQMGNVFLKHTHSLDKFMKGTLQNVSINASPIEQTRIGYQKRNAFLDMREYATAMCAGAKLDHNEESQKVEAYEHGVKDLILINTGGADFKTRFLGLITAPERDACRLRPGDRMNLSFRNLSVQRASWQATVIEHIGIWRKGFLPLSVLKIKEKDVKPTKGEDNELTEEEDNELTDEEDVELTHETQPKTIDPTQMKREVLQRAILEDKYCNKVKVKVAEHDSTFLTVKQAYEKTLTRDLTESSAYILRMSRVLLGRSIDQLPVMDLYNRLRGDVNDPQTFMGSLNKDQKLVTQKSRQLKGGLQIIQGPPGTGKSYLIQQMISPFFVAQKVYPILVAAPTNFGADHLARELRSRLQSMKAQNLHIKSRYILRLHSPSTERAICRTQNTHVSKATEENRKTPTVESEHSQHGLRDAGSSRFPGVNDQRVQDITFSLGYMILCITGIVKGTDYEDPNPGKYEEFRAIYRKMKKEESAKKKNVATMEEWEAQYELLFAQTVAAASAIVSTTHGISIGSLLHKVKHEVAAIFLDENANEREDTLAPLVFTDFEASTCLIIVGDQEQLGPYVSTASSDPFDTTANAFSPQLQLSFMSRMIQAGFPYVMLTEQFRMVEDVSMIPNLLTYKNKLTNASSTATYRRPVAVEFRRFARMYTGQRCNRFLVNVPPSETNKTRASVQGSKTNHDFVRVVRALLSAIASRFSPETTIAVLTPYSDQKSLYVEMKDALIQLNSPLVKMITLGTLHEVEKLNIGTIDTSQGREFDIVILDLPVTRQIGFLDNKKRLNVAVTRAKNGLIIVCDCQAVRWAKGDASYLHSLLALFEGKTWNWPNNNN